MWFLSKKTLKSTSHKSLYIFYHHTLQDERRHAYVTTLSKTVPVRMYRTRGVAAAADARHTLQISQTVSTGNFVQLGIHSRQDTHFYSI